MPEPDYQADLFINENKLDEEWLTQPSRMMDYSSELAQAIYNRNRAKENLDVVEATLDSEARSEPAPAGLGKATETAIKNWIKLQNTYREAILAFHDCDLAANLLQGAVNAFNHRKTALENLVKLYLAGYFGEPNLREDPQPIRERAAIKVRDDLNAALNRPEAAEEGRFVVAKNGENGFLAGPFRTMKSAMEFVGNGNAIFYIKGNSKELVSRWDEMASKWQMIKTQNQPLPPKKPIIPRRPIP